MPGCDVCKKFTLRATDLQLELIEYLDKKIEGSSNVKQIQLTRDLRAGLMMKFLNQVESLIRDTWPD